MRIIIKKKPTIHITLKPIPKHIKIVKMFSVADLPRLGFQHTGRVSGDVDRATLSSAIRTWWNSSPGNEKMKAEGVIALLGWFQPPPSWHEVCSRYNKPVPTPTLPTRTSGATNENQNQKQFPKKQSRLLRIQTAARAAREKAERPQEAKRVVIRIRTKNAGDAC